MKYCITMKINNVNLPILKWEKEKTPVYSIMNEKANINNMQRIIPFVGKKKKKRIHVVQTVKNSPAMSETWVQSVGWEHPLEKGMATHSSILAWRTPWTEEPGGLQSMGWQRVGHSRATKPSNAFSTHFYICIKSETQKDTHQAVTSC